MQIDGSVALVTGANRGFGRELAKQLLERGAKVYATARRPETVDLPGAVPLRLDITDPDSVKHAADAASDVTLLANNAGVTTWSDLLDGEPGDIRLEMETNFFGTLAGIRAFAPVIEGNGGGAILNVLSVLSWRHAPQLGAYVAAKAAAWGMTGALRQQLAPKGIQVAGLHVGWMDTDMAAPIPPEQKSDPVRIAAYALDELAAGSYEIVADEPSRLAKQSLSQPPTAA